MVVRTVIEKPESVPMSLPRTFVNALELLASQDGHANRSAIVRKLIDREMQSQFGADWRINQTLESAVA